MGSLWAELKAERVWGSHSKFQKARLLLYCSNCTTSPLGALRKNLPLKMAAEVLFSCCRQKCWSLERKEVIVILFALTSLEPNFLACESWGREYNLNFEFASIVNKREARKDTCEAFIWMSTGQTYIWGNNDVFCKRAQKFSPFFYYQRKPNSNFTWIYCCCRKQTLTAW